MIYLIEPNKSEIGHYVIYRNSLLKIPGTVHLQCDVDVSPGGNKLWQIVKYYRALRKQLMAVPKGHVAHILYSDIYYKIPFVFGDILKRNKTIVTMHSCPNGRLKHWLMRNFCKRVTKVVVHSEYIKNQMNDMGINNVEYVDYPSFYDYTNIDSKVVLRKRYGVPDGKIVFSALGGIRKDKGLDILLDALALLPLEIKEKMVLNVAGTAYPTFLQETDVKAFCENHGISALLTIRPLTDNEFLENVKLTDFMVMPYRGNMTGNSGPMTEAIVNHIPSIVPDECNLGAIAKKHCVGFCFKQENAKDLAKVIVDAVVNAPEYCFDYAENLKESHFIDKYKSIYSHLL